MPAAFVAPRRALLNRFAALNRLAPRHRGANPLPHMATLRINGSVDLSARLDNIDVSVADDWDRVGEASALIDPRTAAAALRSLKGKSVTVVVDNSGSVMLSTDSGASVPLALPDGLEPLPGAPHDDTPAAAPKRSMTFEAADLRHGFAATVYATDHESTRYALGGVWIGFHGHQAFAAATDSRRLVVAHLPSCASAPSAAAAVLPAVLVRAALDLMPETGEATIDVLPSPRAGGPDVVRLSWDGGSLAGEVVEGRFPRWPDVVPELVARGRAVFSVDRDEALAAWSTAKDPTTADTRGVDWSLNGDGTATCAVQGGATTAHPWRGSLLVPVIRLDARFVVDFLKASPSGSIEVSVFSPDHAVLFVAPDGVRYVQMPLARDR